MKKTLAVLLALAAGLAPLACGDDEEDTPADKPPAMTTPAAVLANVVYSWNQRGINLFEATLSPDFTFYFNPNYVGLNPTGNYVIPESWGYDEMTTAVGNMLVEAYGIDLDIAWENTGTPPAGAPVYTVEKVNIDLTVFETAENGYTADGYCNFEFEKYRANDGRDYWRLRKWWDFTGSGGGASDGMMPWSLGLILALYYK